MRAAWIWVLAQGKLEEIGQSMESLFEFYRIRGGHDEGAELFDAAVNTLGWQGLGAPESPPDESTVFNETMQILGVDGTALEGADEKEVVLGRVLARYSRFY